MISVIICHHKGLLLAGALNSVKKSLKVNFEIIVATSDEHSMPSWEKNFPDVKFIFVKGGPAHKRNIAARFAEGEYFAFYDDDIETMPLALFKMQEQLETNKEVGMVYGKLLNMEFPSRFDEAGSFLTGTGFLYARAQSGIKDQGQFEIVEPILAGKSAACMIRRKVFMEVGGFDVSYEILGEETDLSWRVWLAGHKVVFVPKSVTLHAFNTKFKPRDFYIPRRVYFNGCRNYLSMLLTNLDKKNLAVPVVVQTVVWFFAGMGMFITGKFEAGTNIFKGLIWIITHLDIILIKRHQVQASRKLSDKELLPIIKKNPPFSYYIKRFLHYIKTGRHG